MRGLEVTLAVLPKERARLVEIGMMPQTSEGVGNELVMTGGVERGVGDEEGDLITGRQFAQSSVESLIVPGQVPGEREVNIVSAKEITEGFEMLAGFLVMTLENMLIEGSARMSCKGDEVLHSLTSKVEVLP
jgi:hypothetical protein